MNTAQQSQRIQPVFKERSEEYLAEHPRFASLLWQFVAFVVIVTAVPLAVVLIIVAISLIHHLNI